MNLNKSYLKPIIKAVILITLLVGFYFLEGYHISTIDTIHEDYNKRIAELVVKQNNQHEPMNHDNVDFEKIDNFYKGQLTNLQKQFTRDHGKLQSTINKNEKSYLELKGLHEKYIEQYKKSIHRYIENLLLYNPYLPNDQIVAELEIFIEEEFLPLNIELSQEITLQSNELVVQNNTTSSILDNGLQLIITFATLNPIIDDLETINLELKPLEISSYPFPKMKKAQEKLHDIFEYRLKTIEHERILPLVVLEYCIYAILILLLIRMMYIFIYNRNIKKTIVQNLLNETPLDEKLFKHHSALLVLVQRYNQLVIKRREVMDHSSTIQKKQDQFIADSIHQIKTPLSSIMMNLNLIEMSIDTKEVDEFISQMKTSIDMLTLTYEELSFLSMNNSIEYKPSYINISEVVQQRAEFFKQIALNNDKKIVSSIQSKLFSTINSIELERVVDNNLINAIKYSHQNTKIEISLVKIDEVLYRFVVTSVGNEIKNTEDIFTRHYRESQSTRGHGLGLAITKEICDKYEIQINYKRENGKNIFEYLIKVT